MMDTDTAKQSKRNRINFLNGKLLDGYYHVTKFTILNDLQIRTVSSEDTKFRFYSKLSHPNPLSSNS